MPFSPRRIRSQFQHVFIVVRAVEPCSDNTQYRVAVSRSKEVPVFGPPVPQGAAFAKGKAFADFILAKVINAENAAHRYSIRGVLFAGTARKTLATMLQVGEVRDYGDQDEAGIFERSREQLFLDRCGRHRAEIL